MAGRLANELWDNLNWDDAGIVAHDLETSGRLPEYALQPWRMDRGDMWITSASTIRWTQAGLEPVLSQLFPRKEQIAAFLERAIFNDWTILGWNIAFDISVLMALGPDIEALCFKARWLDGMLMWRHLDIEPEYEFQNAKHLKKSYSLKGYHDANRGFVPGAVQEFIPSFAGLDEDVDFHAVDPVSLAKLQRYNDRDNVRAWTISKIVWSKLALAQRRAVLIQARCLALVAHSNLKGLVVDQLTVKHLGAKLDLDAAALLHDLAPDGMTEEIVRSPAKLGELMFDRWQLPVLKENKSKVEGKANSRSTDKEVLHELAFVDPRVKKIKLYREALNARGKFCESVMESVAYNGDGRTHPVARLFGTYTDRMTVASQQGRGASAVQIGFALHQMKRGKEFREIVTVEDGYDIVEADAAGQEFRWMAIAANDATMLGLCLPGEDAHTFMGAQIVATDYRAMLADVHAENKTAIDNRYLGKFSNLCAAEGTRILTDRGFCNIEQVRDDDLVWDGVEFVAHDGVHFSGVFPVITHCGVSTTHEHEVLTDAGWIAMQEAARYDRCIQSAMGTGWTGRAGAAVRIMDGVARRAVRERWRALRAGAVWLRRRARSQSAVLGDRTLHPLQELCDASATSAGRQADRLTRQRWSLRAWKPAAGYAQGELGQPAIVKTYDIVNCGPRRRFGANGVIIHNSLQYRTSPRKLRSKARVDYDIPLEIDAARRIHATYQRSYPGVPHYWEHQINLVRALGYVETFGGNRIKVVGDWNGTWGWSMGSTAINARIQGTGADQKHLAIAIVTDYLVSIGGRLMFDLHDGLYMAIPSAIRPKAVDVLKKMLDNLPYREAWGFTPPIPMPWDIKVGKAWGRLKEQKFA